MRKKSPVPGLRTHQGGGWSPREEIARDQDSVGSDQVWVRTREEVPQLFTDGQYMVAEGVRR